MHMKYGFTRIFVDPSALSLIEALKNMRLRVYRADNNVDVGISKLKSFFKNDLIYVDKSCVNLIKELESYRYERRHQENDYSERPVKKNDHACDALRYSISEFNPYKNRRVCKGGRW